MAEDYYKILGLSKNASPDEIKRAYRRLAQLHHPDKGGDPQKFKEVNEAYQILSDPQKRSQYDQFGRTFEQAQAGGGFQGFEGFRDFSSFAEAFNSEGASEDNSGLGDIFESIFGGGRRTGRRTKRGADISVDLEISLEESYGGSEREIKLYKSAVCHKCKGLGAEPGVKIKECPTCHGRGEVEQRTGGGFFSFSQIITCPTCGGTGKRPEKACSQCGGDGRIKENTVLKVKIPAGIQDGQVISLTGQGEAASANWRGGRAGDLYITIHVRPDPRFRREGDNLIYELVISFYQAAMGDKIDVPTLDGWVKLKIPEGIESNTVIRLESKGMPHLQRRGFGDMLVKVRVETPKRLSKRAKELLEELKKELE